MINLAILEGRLTAEPELKVIDGKKGADEERTEIVNFTIAVDNWERDSEGNRTTSFFNVVAYGALADITSKYCKKGNLISVAGRLKQRSYTAKDGTKRYVVEVIASEINNLSPKEVKPETGREAPELPQEDEVALTPEEEKQLEALNKKKAKASK